VFPGPPAPVNTAYENKSFFLAPETAPMALTPLINLRFIYQRHTCRISGFFPNLPDFLTTR
jgi:hypothetical protein